MWTVLDEDLLSLDDKQEEAEPKLSVVPAAGGRLEAQAARRMAADAATLLIPGPAAASGSRP